MSDKSVEINPEVVIEKLYTTPEVALLVGLSSKQVGRLADAGYFPGSGRKSPLPGSARFIPGTAVVSFLEARGTAALGVCERSDIPGGGDNGTAVSD